jgi:hypothetical protein
MDTEKIIIVNPKTVKANVPGQTIGEAIQKSAERQIRYIEAHKGRFAKAFVDETGLKPSECAQ